MKKQKESLTIFIPVTNLSGIWKGDFSKLPANKTYTLKVDYPLSIVAKFPIKTGKNGMGLLTLLHRIGKIYEDIYNDEESYGIWGHVINDLSLEGIDIDHKKKEITLCIGS